MSSSAKSPPWHVVSPVGPTSRTERLERNRAQYQAIRAMIDSGETVSESVLAPEPVELRNDSLVRRWWQQLIHSPRGEALREAVAFNVAMLSLLNMLSSHLPGATETHGKSTGKRP